MMNKKFDIRTHVLWFTLLPMLLMVMVIEAFFLHDRYTELDHNLINNGQLIARQLAASSEYGVFSGNRMFLDGVAESALQQTDVRGLVVLDATESILVGTGDLKAVLAIKDKPSARNLLKLVNRGVPVFDNGKTVLLYQPILSSQIELNELAPQSDVLQVGAIVIEMSWEKTQQFKTKLFWFALLVTAGFLIFTLVLMRIASHRIVEPIKKLSDAIVQVGAGKLETRVEMSGSVLELCALSAGINQMAADLQLERDILQQRIDEATLQLSNLAFYDTLTNLPNRRLLNDRLAQALAASSRSGHYGAVMFIDLDNFKSLNDMHGHAMGDLLLIEAARRISMCLREMDTVARFGGDEFVVMLSVLDSELAKSVELAQQVAEKIRRVLAEPYHLVSLHSTQPEISIEHQCTSSIGLALFLGHEISQETLMSCADAAMYIAKRDGRNRIFFHPSATLSVLT